MAETEEEKYNRLKREIEILKAKNTLLREERRLKLEAVKQRFHNIYPEFAAKHPWIAIIGEGLAAGGKRAVKFAEENQGISRELLGEPRRFQPKRKTHKRSKKKFAYA
jgi:hypothetical protein